MHPYNEALERGYLSLSDDSDDDPVGMETMGRGGGGVSGDTDSEESMASACMRQYASVCMTMNQHASVCISIESAYNLYI